MPRHLPNPALGPGSPRELRHQLPKSLPRNPLVRIPRGTPFRSVYPPSTIHVPCPFLNFFFLSTSSPSPSFLFCFLGFLFFSPAVRPFPLSKAETQDSNQVYSGFKPRLDSQFPDDLDGTRGKSWKEQRRRCRGRRKEGAGHARAVAKEEGTERRVILFGGSHFVKKGKQVGGAQGA